jgi:CRP/FNR family transcriptional regulator, cyclic AMP receptor protein
MMNHAEKRARTRRFDPGTFLATMGEGRRNVSVARKQVVFSQGDVADAVFYIKKKARSS